MKETKEKRSHTMRSVRSWNTTPELIVRQALRTLGFTGYRLHRKDIKGRPDVAFIGRKKVIFINGCFWHGHQCAHGQRKPKNNADYWFKKISGNQHRDTENLSTLNKQGWDCLVIWECEIHNKEKLFETLVGFLHHDNHN
ncbi:very short patch repair endonuclease [Trichloromonas sp.]|uniref:very short patch repair endonuclease n=1 Tax=Trichloromonas sp. TaxID=3069249 RepID=UPI002A3894F1|nr:very short patch repair endonuclease [Trichloromonas sp.]